MPKVTLDELRNSRFRVLIFGPTGTGKTTLAGSAVYVPSLLPLFYADFESGKNSIAADLEARWGDVTVWNMRDSSDASVLSKAMFDAKSPYKTVVLDSLSELHAFFMAQHLESKGRAQGMPSQPDYGEISNIVLRLLRRTVRENRINLIATAGDTQATDEASGVIYTAPDITGKLDFRVTRYFDVVGYLTAAKVRLKGEGLTKEKTVRTLQLEPYGRVRAKVRLVDREQEFEGFLKDPTMQDVYDLVTRGTSALVPEAIGEGMDTDAFEEDVDDDSDEEENSDNG